MHIYHMRTLVIIFFLLIPMTAECTTIIIPGSNTGAEQMASLQANIPAAIVIYPVTMMPLSAAAESIKSQLDAQKIETVETIIGYSWGGLIARELSGRYPKLQVKKIIQIGTPNGGYKHAPSFIFRTLQTSADIYIIAGASSSRKWYLTGLNDGTVDLDSVLSIPSKEHVIFNLNHAELVRDIAVIQKIIQWMKK